MWHVSLQLDWKGVVCRGTEQKHFLHSLLDPSIKLPHFFQIWEWWNSFSAPFQTFHTLASNCVCVHYLYASSTCVCAHSCPCLRHQVCEQGLSACLLTWRLPGGHGRLSHAGRPLWEARGGHARLSGHHALLLEPCPPLLLQFLLDLIDLLCQQVVVLRLAGTQHDRRRREKRDWIKKQESKGCIQIVQKQIQFFDPETDGHVTMLSYFLTLLLADSYMSPSTFRA